MRRADRAVEHNAGYLVSVERDWEAARPILEANLRADTKSPFQSIQVLDSWYRAMAIRSDLEPLIVSAFEPHTKALALSLPLVRRNGGSVRTISFADEGLIDYNAPILGDGAPQTPESSARLWQSIIASLPPADLIDFRKMPTAVGARANPLALLSTLPSALNGNVVHAGENYQEHVRATLRRQVRKELERSWRVFSRHPDAYFRVVDDIDQRRTVLAAIESQQPVRMRHAGNQYELGRPEAADFYRRLVEGDPSGTFVVVTALVAADQIVAALMGLRNGDSFTMIRISSTTSPEWTNCSPGRLVIERTMAHLHALGVRSFDFSIGNYDYKRRFGVQPSDLVDLLKPLTPLGMLSAAAAHGRTWLRRHPALHAMLQSLRGVFSTNGPKFADDGNEVGFAPAGGAVPPSLRPGTQENATASR